MAALGAATVALLAGCGSSSTSPGTAASPGKLNRAAELRVSSNAFGTSFDPHLSRNFATDVPWDFPIYDRLLQFSNNKLLPMLAESWKLSDDRMSLKFNLRKGVTFQDGTPFNADAVSANIKRGKELTGSTVVKSFSLISSVEVVDATTVVLHLTGDGTLLQYTLADIPGGMISPAAFTGNVGQKPVGAGPYRFVSATTDTATYTRFDKYWNPEGARAAKLTYKSIPDDNARFNALQTGQLDVIQLPATIFTQATQLANSGKAKIEAQPATALIGLMLNVNQKSLADEKVRLAMNFAIDREAINKGLLQGQCPAAVQPFPAGAVGYDKSLDSKITYNPTKAKQLLDEAGVKDLTITTDVVGVSPYTDVAAAMQEQLSKVGVTLKLTNLPGSDARAKWRTGVWDSFVGLVTAGPDPALTLSTSYLTNDAVGGPGSDKLTGVVAEVNKYAVGTPERESALKKVSAYLVASPRHVPACAPKFEWLTGSNVVVTPGAFYAYSYIFDPTLLGISS
jgi:peptide/nickel transport system substrate-binding protein